MESVEEQHGTLDHADLRTSDCRFWFVEPLPVQTEGMSRLPHAPASCLAASPQMHHELRA